MNTTFKTQKICAIHLDVLYEFLSGSLHECPLLFKGGNYITEIIEK